MIVQTAYNWTQAKASRFNADKIRSVAKRVPKKQEDGFRIEVSSDCCVSELKEWFTDNELTSKDYQMYGLFDERRTRMYFHGLAFVFKDSDLALMFKLRFN